MKVANNQITEQPWVALDNRNVREMNIKIKQEKTVKYSGVVTALYTTVSFVLKFYESL